jgi:hypothetical protein
MAGKTLLQNTNGDTDFEELEQEDYQTVLRAAGETETTQKNFQDGLSWMNKTLGFSF